MIDNAKTSVFIDLYSVMCGRYIAWAETGKATIANAADCPLIVMVSMPRSGPRCLFAGVFLTVAVLFGPLNNAPAFAEEPPVTGDATEEAGGQPGVSSEEAVDAPISAKILRYASRVISAYDRDGDETLSAAEMKAMRGNPKSADLDGDGSLEVAEFAQYVANFGRRRRVRLLFSPETTEADDVSPVDATSPGESESDSTGGNGAPASGGTGRTDAGEPDAGSPPSKIFHVRQRQGNLPAWFTARDADGDGQVSVAEFAPNASRAETTEFAGMDKNGDGFITARELVGPRMVKETRRYLHRDSPRLPSQATQSSEAKPDSAQPAAEGAAGQKPSPEAAPAPDQPQAAAEAKPAKKKGRTSRKGGQGRMRRR